MRKIVACLVVFVLVGISLPLGSANGELDYYVSSPGNIPNLQNFSTPQLEPGESGPFSLQLTNRYVAPMENVTLTAEIYMWADTTSAVVIEQIRHPPRIKEATSSGGANEQQMNWMLGTLPANTTAFLGFNITTTENTDEGTYFVSFALNFDFNGTQRVMLSRGHWNATEWEAATSDGSPGNLNLTRLGVDGIIPDSSFGVRESGEMTLTEYLLQTVLWWLIGIGLTAVVLGVAALIIRVRREKD